MKKVCIIQSSYIPWKGYFDLINSVDECIIYDDVQFTKRDWRTRNMIPTSNGLKWLTIPVSTKGKYFQNIEDVKVVDSKWCTKHWNAIQHNYSNAPFFHSYKKQLGELFKQLEDFDHLSDINLLFINYFCKILNIKTLITKSKDYGFSNLKKTDRLVALCKAAKATHYLSGPSAKDYIESNKFEKEGIVLEYMSYSNYPTYSQVHTPFKPNVSIIDLVLCTGPNIKSYMKSFN